MTNYGCGSRIIQERGDEKSQRNQGQSPKDEKRQQDRPMCLYEESRISEKYIEIIYDLKSMAIPEPQKKAREREYKKKKKTKLAKW